MSAKQTPTWEQYIGALLEKGYVARAAICRIKDGKRWAASPRFDVTAAEVMAIAAGFEDGGAKLRETGLCVGYTQYTLTRVNTTMMVGRCAATGSGCVIYRCGSCFVIGVYEDSACAGGCFNIITRMGDFLRYDGY
ncbi:profilin-1-like [Haliotis rubra]|uniref:profilin-1-like n=1 Tax=Haliotis rubra TaxID=36100 RepID=UPI001EE516F5|nr:profilin-1-like [Haliotis rubra]